MNITIFGSGYVGLVTGCCLAQTGNDVLLVDIDPARIKQLQAGECPIYEPGLQGLISGNLAAGRLAFTQDAAAGVAHGTLLMIAVGTPPDEDGSADLQHVLAVARTIGRHMSDYRIIINKSTVPVGTADQVARAISKELLQRQSSCEFDVVSNPEFLKEGAAIDDFMRPDRIIIGCSHPRPLPYLRKLYAPFNRNHDRLIAMDVHSAELTKYAANALLATKISFMNELSNLAERLGADIEQVRLGIGADPRIGYQYIYPGCGYGGSCFPKDVRALDRTAREQGYKAELLQAVEAINLRQKKVLFEKIQRHYQGKLQDKTFAIWGAAFKPNTDDIREASSRTLMESLWAAGARVRIHDPKALDALRHHYGERSDLEYCQSANQALSNADALVVVTEWSQFRSPDFDELARSLRAPVIFDGRNLYSPEELATRGFTYYSIGRPSV